MRKLFQVKYIFKCMVFVVLVVNIYVSGKYAMEYWRYVWRRPAISVVMSTYNRADRVSAAIDSILHQTFNDFEFIIINDGSADNTMEILQKYAESDERIKIIDNKENKGLIYSLNVGLDMARGKYIARMDDDDVSLLNRFERQFSFMEEHPKVAVVSSWVAPLGETEPYSFQRETDPDKIKIMPYLDEVPISHPASFIRREFIDKHKIRYREKYKNIEDRPFWTEIMDAGGVITNIPEVLLQYRLHYSNSADYYKVQVAGKILYHKELMARLIGDAAYDDNIHNCDKYSMLLDVNKEKNLLNQAKLKKMIGTKCIELHK